MEVGVEGCLTSVDRFLWVRNREERLPLPARFKEILGLDHDVIILSVRPAVPSLDRAARVPAGWKRRATGKLRALITTGPVKVKCRMPAQRGRPLTNGMCTQRGPAEQ